MAALHFELVSPARLVFSGRVASVTIPGTEGEMGIYPGHAPVLTTLRPGVVTVMRDGGAAERIFVKGGMAEVNPQGLTLLAEVAIPVAEVTADMMARQIKDAELDLSAAKPGEAQRKAVEVLSQLKALQAAL